MVEISVTSFIYEEILYKWSKRFKEIFFSSFTAKLEICFKSLYFLINSICQKCIFNMKSPKFGEFGASFIWIFGQIGASKHSEG